jgi:hypothetical protein
MKFVGVASLLLVSTFIFAGCSSESSSSFVDDGSSISGNVSGSALVAQSAVARFGDVETIASDGSIVWARGLTVLVSDAKNDCSNLHTEGATSVELTIPGSASPGAYAVTGSVAGSGQSQAHFSVVDRSCANVVDQLAPAGDIDIEHMNITIVGDQPSNVSGNVDASFAGGKLTGSFDAVICPDDAPTSKALGPSDDGKTIPISYCAP